MVTVYACTSFPRTREGGNKAGVCILEAFPDAEQMQRIAAEVGFSETAFVVLDPINGSKQQVRFFTPEVEVAICGHATVAAYAVLFEQGYIQAGIYTMNCPAGDKSIEITVDGRVRLEQGTPQFLETFDGSIIKKTCALSTTLLWEKLPPRVVSVGLPIALIGVTSSEALSRIIPNDDTIKQVLEQLDAVILYVVAPTERKHTWSARMFAPNLGISEEPATGMAAGALGAYLFHTGLSDTSTMNIWQGDEMKQPSEIQVSVEQLDQMRTNITIEGTATILHQMNITL